MARVEGVPAGANPFVRVLYAVTRRKLGRMVETVSVAAHHPRLLLGMGAFDQALSSSHRVPARMKSLAELQVASRVGCPF